MTRNIKRSVQVSKRPKVEEIILDREVCEEATFLLNGPRKDDYGPLEVNMIRWRDAVRILVPGLEEITAEQLAKAMIVLKMSREAAGHKRDNLVDLAAYGEIADRMHTYEDQE